MANNKNRKRPKTDKERMEILGIILRTSDGDIEMDTAKVTLVDKKTKKPIIGWGAAQ